MRNPSSSSHQGIVGDTSDEKSFAFTVHPPWQDAMIQENIDDGTLKEGVSPSRILSDDGTLIEYEPCPSEDDMDRGPLIR